MKLGAELAREVDRGEKRFAAGSLVIQVDGDQDVLVHVSLALSFAITGVC
jgi:hypothetical protein